MTFRDGRDIFPFIEFVNMRVHNQNSIAVVLFQLKYFWTSLLQKKAKRESRVKISHGRATVMRF
ncbi:MAG: hypothetical protein LC768_14670 [Acidobacteria bacterium]|nr:hypothetical protein [Acidobacteriota bacterium]